ncbi:MAG: TatD family hydrolase [Clostridiales bacterium]|jgi:TatD DNase family protein|nr:TatD family hydrolase [Clostridiales bacterium]
MIFDTHAHYDDGAFDTDREDLLLSLPRQGIEYVVNVCSAIDTVDKTINLMETYSHVYGAIGIHPECVMDLNEERVTWLIEKAKHPKTVAIGEIGLDYYWETVARDVQKKWFLRQIDIARELKLPLVVHSRDAAQDTLELIKHARADEIGGIIHCFGYGVEQAKQYLSMGFYLGIGGVVTFNNGRKLKEVVTYAPLEQLVIETDCPYLSPVPFRGKRNSSLNIPYIVKEIAGLKNIDEETVIRVTSENAKKVYFNRGMDREVIHG